MIRTRAFERDPDLAAVLELVGRSRARREAGAIFHPGGLQWWLRRLGRPGFDVAVLSADDKVVGFVLRDRSDVIVQADPAHAEGRALLLAWAEERAREGPQDELLVSVAEEDEGLRQAALARGYVPTDRYGYELVYELAGEPAGPELPPGFEMLSLAPTLADVYIDLHRAAWSRPDAPSTYERVQHQVVTAMPDFRYDLVPIVASATGELAAYGMGWWDPRSASVEIEPLGTHPEFRRRGLARAIVREVIRRSWALDAEYVLVWGSSTLPDAKALYLSAGLHCRRVLRDHRLKLR